MTSPEERAVIDAAVEWYDACGPYGPTACADTPMGTLAETVERLVAARTPPREHALTWGQVPAGWEVLAPDGKWYRVTETRSGRTPNRFAQVVTLEGIGTHPRDPQGPVTARGSDPAIEALGFPDVLEDGS